MGQFGIGRVPRDVDATTEELAVLEARQLMAALLAQGASAYEQYLLADWQCCEFDDLEDPQRRERCPERQVNLAIHRSHTMGCAVMCERHWLAYNRPKLLANGIPPEEWTVATVLRLHAAEAAREAEEEHYCRRCGDEGATWNSGAGQYLCYRDWDNY